MSFHAVGPEDPKERGPMLLDCWFRVMTTLHCVYTIDDAMAVALSVWVRWPTPRCDASWDCIGQSSKRQRQASRGVQTKSPSLLLDANCTHRATVQPCYGFQYITGVTIQQPPNHAYSLNVCPYSSRMEGRRYIFGTRVPIRNSADAENRATRLEASQFAKNMVPFDMLGMVSY